MYNYSNYKSYIQIKLIALFDKLHIFYINNNDVIIILLDGPKSEKILDKLIETINKIKLKPKNNIIKVEEVEDYSSLEAYFD